MNRCWPARIAPLTQPHALDAQNAASKWLMHYLKVLNSWLHTDRYQLKTTQLILKIGLVDALKSTSILTSQWSRPVFLVVSITLGLFYEWNKACQVVWTLQDISNKVHLQVVARRVLSVLTNGHHINSRWLRCPFNFIIDRPCETGAMAAGLPRYKLIPATRTTV